MVRAASRTATPRFKKSRSRRPRQKKAPIDDDNTTSSGEDANVVQSSHHSDSHSASQSHSHSDHSEVDKSVSSPPSPSPPSPKSSTLVTLKYTTQVVPNKRLFSVRVYDLFHVDIADISVDVSQTAVIVHISNKTHHLQPAHKKRFLKGEKNLWRNNTFASVNIPIPAQVSKVLENRVSANLTTDQVLDIKIPFKFYNSQGAQNKRKQPQQETIENGTDSGYHNDIDDDDKVDPTKKRKTDSDKNKNYSKSKNKSDKLPSNSTMSKKNKDNLGIIKNNSANKSTESSNTLELAIQIGEALQNKAFERISQLQGKEAAIKAQADRKQARKLKKTLKKTELLNNIKEKESKAILEKDKVAVVGLYESEQQRSDIIKAKSAAKAQAHVTPSQDSKKKRVSFG